MIATKAVRVRARGRSLTVAQALAGVSATALMLTLPQTVFAQSAPAQTAQAATPQTAQAPSLEEIVVTGTRIVRNGYQAPTPLTVMSEEQIQAAAPENIADFVNKLPSLAGSSTPINSNLSFSNGQAGVNALNLRDLGTNRTLVLLDGQRSVASTITGAVDINTFPQQLVTRVDIVTGGASAQYGSDAVSGVVNFILDKTFTGIKGEVSGGVTTYGDDRNWKLDLTGGTGFANDRGHFLFSGEIDDKYGIFGVPRAWNNNGILIMNNPAYAAGNGQPQELVETGAGLAEATLGGIIVSGPLKGVAFGPGGLPYQFQYGPTVDYPFMVGGAWQSTQANNLTSLDPQSFRDSVFTRVSYDITEDIQAFAQYQWNTTRSVAWALNQFNIGNIVISAANPFIPAAVAAQVAANGLTSLTIGSNNGDTPPVYSDNERRVTRTVLGGNGKFEAFDSSWTWDTYWQHGDSMNSENGFNVTAKTNFSNALAAVKGPNGSIVCASTLTNPGNGCVPYDPLGLGVNSQAALNYIYANGQHPQRDERFVEDVEAATAQGEPFSDWAGPISIATGVEHRREAVSGIADAISLANGWFAGNYLATFGHYEVTEGFVETVVPLAKDQPWAKELDLNAAVRATDYSTSGYVTTWKLGATYAPVDDLHLRATQSRDIRAPNLNDLFQAGTANTSNVTDPANGNQVTTYQGLSVGNANLKPEVANTTELGFVMQPSFVPGFSASFDWYNINLSNAIGSLSAQNIVNFCYTGQTQYCSAITRGIGSGGGSVITQIRVEEFNFVRQQAQGFDIDASYQLHLSDVVSSWNGALSLRALATHYIKNVINDGVDPVYNSVGNMGGGGPPHWSYHATLDYSNDPIDVSLTGRGVSSGVYNVTNVQCTSGCPTSAPTAITINNNQIAGAFYLDANITYKFKNKAESGVDAEAFFSVANLTNKDPAIVASGPGGFPYASPPDNPDFYDVLGRVFRAGIRFKM